MTSNPGNWRPITDPPDIGRKIVALYGDGSGSRMFYRYDGGYIDPDGHDFGDIDGFVIWSYLPPDFRLWCEDQADDPLTLPTPADLGGGAA